MCGIIGYKGTGEAGPVLTDSLKRLEYRGYDSYGFATVSGGKLLVRRGVGKISDNSNEEALPGSMGIGHTRWATHGGVTEYNAHPHTDCRNSIAVVHNGIIENYQELKAMLLSRGHKFSSETDTEVIPHLIEENMGAGFVEAVRKAVSRIRGRYAVVAISRDSGSMVAVRRGSPLIVGVGKGSYYVASDIPAFMEHTRNVMYLDDNQMLVLNNGPEFYDLLTGDRIEKRTVQIQWDAKQAEKGEYEHFLIKEIMEQKDTIMRAINQKDEDIMSIADEINRAFGTFLTGCGTAGKVCLAAEYLFSKIANKHINFIVSSEFPNYHHFLREGGLMIAISQSGETADVLEAAETAKVKKVKVISLVNVMGSTLDRMSDHSFLINAGPEKAVASTKATTAQMALMTLLAYASAGKLQEGKNLLMEAASKVNDMLNPRYEERIRALAERIKEQPNVYIIGRSLNYPMALEAAIKIMEVSNIHAQGFAGGELKHGPLAMIEQGVPVIALTGNDEVRSDVISNAMEAKSRGAFIIGVGPEKNEVFDYWLRVPDVGDASPIVNIIPIQILAYHLGVLRGCDPDYCKNLAKSVTVK
jgi:glucosamine--fructose-6-phosphate aminotransferase (isomerizing)